MTTPLPLQVQLNALTQRVAALDGQGLNRPRSRVYDTIKRQDHRLAGAASLQRRTRRIPTNPTLPTVTSFAPNASK